MNELIKIELKENGQQLVNARDLHEYLELSEQFSDWIKRNIKKYEFEENVDYIIISGKSEISIKSRVEYHLTLDTAKELSMISDSAKGKIARKYFIECEKQLRKKPLPSTYKEALKALVEQIEISEKLEQKANNLSTVLDNLLDYASILRVALHNKIHEKNLSWRFLKNASERLGHEIKRVPSVRFKYQNLYHVDVFKVCYPNLNYELKQDYCDDEAEEKYYENKQS